MPLRLITSLLLIIAMLCNGVALAADVHLLSTEQAHSISDHTGNPADSDVEDHYDHCYHINLHMLGMNSTVTLHLTTDRSLSLSQYAFSSNTFTPPLPLRPPIPA
jgi:hypothetical protein